MQDCANRHHVGTISAVGGNPRNVEPNQARSASGAEAVCEAVVTRQVDCAESLQGADKPVIDAIKDAAADGTDEAVDGTPSDDVVDDEIEDGYKCVHCRIATSTPRHPACSFFRHRYCICEFYKSSATTSSVLFQTATSVFRCSRGHAAGL